MTRRVDRAPSAVPSRTPGSDVPVAPGSDGQPAGWRARCPSGSRRSDAVR